MSVWKLIFNANAGLFLHRRKAEITDIHRKVSWTVFLFDEFGLKDSLELDYAIKFEILYFININIE